MDRDGDGIVTDGRELFGSATPLSEGLKGKAAANGYEALRIFDQSQNGGDGNDMITPDDRVFSRLRLWFDSNQNGHSEVDEIASLAEKRVAMMDLEYSRIGWRDEFGNALGFRSRFVIQQDSELEVRDTFDVFFAGVPASTTAEQVYGVPHRRRP